MCSQQVTTLAIEKPRLPLGEFSSSRINKLGNIRGKPTASATSLPSIKSLIDCTPAVSASIEVGNPKRVLDENEFHDIAQRLRLRLQLAYFKLRTNQVNIKFKDLRKHSSVNPMGVKSTGPKRRKLVVGHGNLKTPAKSTIHQYSLTKLESINGHENDKSSQNYLKFYNHTTPLGKSSISQQQNQKQETPMSVKAAKSLIHLFTSSQK